MRKATLFKITLYSRHHFWTVSLQNLHQVGWGESVHVFFSDVQSGTTLGSSLATQGQSQSDSDISHLVSCLCALTVFLLEDEPFPRGPDRSGTDYYQESPVLYYIHLYQVAQFLLRKNIPTGRCCHHHASMQEWYWPGNE